MVSVRRMRAVVMAVVAVAGAGGLDLGAPSGEPAAGDAIVIKLASG